MQITGNLGEVAYARLTHGVGIVGELLSKMASLKIILGDTKHPMYLRPNQAM